MTAELRVNCSVHYLVKMTATQMDLWKVKLIRKDLQTVRIAAWSKTMGAMMERLKCVNKRAVRCYKEIDIPAKIQFISKRLTTRHIAWKNRRRERGAVTGSI
jgi:hypothetical protein